MVVKMIKWRPWPPSQSKKFEARIMVRSITGLLRPIDGGDGDDRDDGVSGLMVEIKWKGSRTNGFRSLRKKSVKSDSTREEKVGENGVVSWDEEFKTVCGFCGSKADAAVFNPWEVSFLLFNASEKRSKKRVPLSAPSVLDLAEFASLEDAKELQFDIPLTILHSCFNCTPSLSISLSLVELTTGQELPEVQRPMFVPLSPCFGTSLPTKKDEGSTFKSSLRKVKSLTDYVSSRRRKKTYSGEASSDSKFSTGSEDSECNYTFDTDSFDDTEEDESGESKEDFDVQKSCSYGTLVDANLAGGALDLRITCEDEDLVYNSNNNRDADSSPAKDFGAEESEQVLRQSPRFKILAWRKRRLSFKSPKVKGEPLLKKHYGEGGDDIDFDRRQLSSDESMAQVEESVGSVAFVSEFGDDNFAIGSWEQKDILSRDGGMKLQTEVFFASIDQRSERAAGESACTALVAVIADWLHSNQGEIPIKSEFDRLIREGSLQWRNLCENDAYRERFPDKHFDLETVLQAKIRPLSVVPERSFIGFFHPEGLEEECFGFLHGAMSFDSIWDEISQAASEQNPDSEPLVYVVSWNDHFFLLRVDWDAYYIIDTLGERLFEGCQQAYVLKFDQNSTIERIRPQPTSQNEKPTKEKADSSKPHAVKSECGSPDRGSGDGKEEEMVVCKGKDSCKEYVKSFLAAIPIRELQADMKKGLMASTPLHHRLQIEFNYTAQFSPMPEEYVGPEIVADVLAPSDADMAAPEVPKVEAPEVPDVAEPMATEVTVPVAADVSVLNVANAPTTMVALAVS